jgi:hypothetical protein
VTDADDDRDDIDDIDAPLHPDPDIRRVEYGLWLLEALSHMGMGMAQAPRDEVVTIHRSQVGTPRDSFGDKYDSALVAAIADAPKPPHPAAGFARLSRAIRLTVMREGRLHAALMAPRAGSAVSVDVCPPRPEEDRPKAERAARSPESPPRPPPRTRKSPLRAAGARRVPATCPIPSARSCSRPANGNGGTRKTLKSWSARSAIVSTPRRPASPPADRPRQEAVRRARVVAALTPEPGRGPGEPVARPEGPGFPTSCPKPGRKPGPERAGPERAGLDTAAASPPRPRLD